MLQSNQVNQGGQTQGINSTPSQITSQQEQGSNVIRSQSLQFSGFTNPVCQTQSGLDGTQSNSNNVTPSAPRSSANSGQQQLSYTDASQVIQNQSKLIAQLQRQSATGRIVQ